MPNEKKFYVYVHRRVSDGKVFYVGKGKGKRAWCKSTRSDWWKRVESKHGRTVHIIVRNVQETCAFSIEVALISFLGSGELVNMTRGGEGASGSKRSSEFASLMRDRMSGDKNPMFGRHSKLTSDHKIKIGLSNRKPKPKGFGDAVKLRMIGSVVSDEIKAKKSATMIGRHSGENNPMFGKSGSLSPSSDLAIRTFYNSDGSFFTGIRSEFTKKYGLSGDHVGKIISGKRRTHKGWSYAPE